MTNYRLRICEEHDRPQFNFCFDCGAPLVEERIGGENTLTCSMNPYHVRIRLELRHLYRGSECGGIQVR